MSLFFNKSILIISPESWGDSMVSKHHYAIELAKNGTKVFFLNKPSNCFEINEISTNLSVVNCKARFKGLRYLPEFLSAFLIKLEIQNLEKLTKTKFDVIWNFDSSRFFNLKSVAKSLKICHIVDMAENIERPLLAQSSDICFCTSDYIKNELLQKNPRVFKINHGYQLPENQSTFELKKDSKFLYHSAFVANLSRKCIDWQTILEMVKDNQNVQFHFVGAYTKSNLSNQDIDFEMFQSIQNQPNTVFYGAVNAKFMPSILEQMDVLFCVYKMDTEADFAQHSNLHKIMEYLGSGKMILTSWVDEYKNTDLLWMEKQVSDIPARFKHLLLNLESLNSVENQQKRKIFAFQNTYSEQLKKIELFILSNVEK
jgi:hypothetical protein